MRYFVAGLLSGFLAVLVITAVDNEDEAAANPTCPVVVVNQAETPDIFECR